MKHVNFTILFFPAIDQEEVVDQSTGMTYDMFSKACIALMVEKNGGFRRRVPRQLILNRGQIGARTVGFDLAAYSLLSAGAKSKTQT